MAAYDIMPTNSPLGGHTRLTRFPFDTSATFLVGEPVFVNVDGQLDESPDDPSSTQITGIALAPPSYNKGNSGNGTAFTAVTTNWQTDTNYAVGDPVQVVIPNSDTYFITQNFSAAGSAFDDTAPAAANIYDECGLSLIGGVWGVDISAANNTCRIVDILDSRKQSIIRTGDTISTGTTYYVVFQIVAHQGNSNAGVVDAPAADV